MLKAATFLCAMGIACAVMGGVELLPALMQNRYAFVAIVLATSGAAGAGVYAGMRRWNQEKRRARNLVASSPFASEWIGMLYGDYTPYIAEAAERLAAAREVTAVPALLDVLDQTLKTRAPGWQETAEALAAALGCMGDRCALPLLHRLTAARMPIALRSVAAEAMDRIEPETSLLRAGSAEAVPGVLLRPIDEASGTDPAVLLRPGCQ